MKEIRREATVLRSTDPVPRKTLAAYLPNRNGTGSDQFDRDTQRNPAPQASRVSYPSSAGANQRTNCPVFNRGNAVTARPVLRVSLQRRQGPAYSRLGSREAEITAEVATNPTPSVFVTNEKFLKFFVFPMVFSLQLSRQRRY